MSDADRGPRLSDEEILSVFAEFEDEQLQAGQIADDLPIEEDRLRERLDELEELDLLRRDDEDLPGEQWRLTEDGRERAQVPEDEIESTVEAQATKTTGSEAPPLREETPESPPPDPDDDPFGSMPSSPEGEVEAFVAAETPDVEQRRREAIRRVYEYLRQHGPATRADLEADVFPDATGTYERSDTWWDELVRPGLGTIPAVDRLPNGDAWDVSEDGADSPSA